jgi:hypothetical protein
LLQDIEESGEGVASFKIKTLFHRKPDTYRLCAASYKKKQIQNKLDKWRALASNGCCQLLASLGVHPNGTRSPEESKEKESEEEEEESSTPTPPARLNNLPPRSPPSTRSISIMSTPNRNRTPNRTGTPSSGRSITDLMSQMSSECQCSSSFLCAQMMDASNRPFLLCFKANDLDANEEWLLNFEESKNNNGMLVYQSDVVIRKEVVECISVLKPMYDMREVRNKRITATLLRDGSGIRVSERTVPLFLLDSPHSSCERSDTQHMQSLSRGSRTKIRPVSSRPSSSDSLRG